MAKSSYSRKKKLTGKQWAIIIVAALVLFVVGKICYNNYVYGEIDLSGVAPGNEVLDHIGANWQQLEASELFVNPYADPAAAAAGSPEAMAAASGGVTYLQYTGNEALEYAIIMINTGTPIEGENVVQYNGAFSRTTFTEFIDGVAPWGQVSLQLTVGNNSSIIQVFDSGADSVSTDALAEILAAVESIIGAP